MTPVVSKLEEETEAEEWILEEYLNGFGEDIFRLNLKESAEQQKQQRRLLLWSK